MEIEFSMDFWEDHGRIFNVAIVRLKLPRPQVFSDGDYEFKLIWIRALSELQEIQ